MKPFEPAALPPEAFSIDAMMASFGLDQAEAQEMVEFNKTQRVYLNNKYQVNVRDEQPRAEGWPRLLWLSIKRRDREPIRDWRVLQEIKNLIVGPEHEAVELFPAESRLVDTANQYHLWVIADPAVRFPFGFEGRMVTNAKQAAAMRAKQRDPSYQKMAATAAESAAAST